MALLEMLEHFGRSLPYRRRIKGDTETCIQIVPTPDSSKVCHVIDKFVPVEENNDEHKVDRLEQKQLVLFIGKGSHHITRDFQTPKLAMIYHFLTLKRDDVEFIYVSLDKTQEEFDTFTQSHPWPCIPWEDKNLRDMLHEKYYVPLKKSGGCALVVLDADHVNVLNKDATPIFNRTASEKGNDFPWTSSDYAQDTTCECCLQGVGNALCTIL